MRDREQCLDRCSSIRLLRPHLHHGRDPCRDLLCLLLLRRRRRLPALSLFASRSGLSRMLPQVEEGGSGLA